MLLASGGEGARRAQHPAVPRTAPQGRGPQRSARGLRWRSPAFPPSPGRARGWGGRGACWAEQLACVAPGAGAARGEPVLPALLGSSVADPAGAGAESPPAPALPGSLRDPQGDPAWGGGHVGSLLQDRGRARPPRPPGAHAQPPCLAPPSAKASWWPLGDWDQGAVLPPRHLHPEVTLAHVYSR